MDTALEKKIGGYVNVTFKKQNNISVYVQGFEGLM